MGIEWWLYNALFNSIDFIYHIDMFQSEIVIWILNKKS